MASLTAAPRRVRLFVDLDGVLADFDRRVVELTGRAPDAIQPKRLLWVAISPPRCPDFYASLDMMPDAKELWEYVSPHRPTILTGLPLGSWAAPQKVSWCASRLGAGVPVITCMARDKHTHCGVGDILVDDREETARGPWEAAGGVFVHHTSAATTIAALSRLLPPAVEGGGGVAHSGRGPT